MSAPAVTHSDEAFGLNIVDPADAFLGDRPAHRHVGRDRPVRRRGSDELAPARGMIMGLVLGMGGWAAIMAVAALSLRLF